MTATAENDASNVVTTTYRIRLHQGDVNALKDLARREGVRLGKDVGWCELVRCGIKKMVRTQSPVIDE